MDPTIMIGIVAVVAALIAVITFAQPRSCPKCGAQLPRVRKPTSIKQLLWGGWKCPACGCEIDRLGRQI
jgi:transposase